MENEEQLNNNNEQDLGLQTGDDTDWNNDVEYDMAELLGGEDDLVNTNQSSDDDENNHPPSKRSKRFTVPQVQELEAKYQLCTHPDAETRQELGARIGLEERQVRFWFQNRRSAMKLKTCGIEMKGMQEENTRLLAENKKLRQMITDRTCFRCLDPTGEIQRTSPDMWQLLTENARLKEELLQAKASLDSFRQSERSPYTVSSEHPASDYTNPVPFTYDCRTSQATLLSHAQRALKEFVMVATKGQPLWVQTTDGEVLSDQQYNVDTFPGLLGICPLGFIAEATRDTDVIKSTAMDIVSILTDVAHWSHMFSGIVAYVNSSNVISSGASSSRDGLIQLMDADFWVQSPRLPTRNVKFMRFSKMMPNRQWAVVDVSLEGNGVQQESSRTTDYRLLPSGCLLEDMSGGFCKVTWVVHGQYHETTVPTHYRQFVQSGKAFGASRWLRSLERQCEYMSILNSSNVPRSSTSSSSAGAPITALGRKGVLELAQRMTASFYAAVSGPVTVASTNIVDQWYGGSDPDAERLQAFVRMVTWNCAEIMPGEPAITVLSASTTVWLPSTTPVLVLEYLCNLQSRAEWDTFVNGGAVQELGRVATSAAHLNGNAVSVLRSNVVAEGTNNNMLILQQTSTDVSGSLVVYSLIEENLMRGIMRGADNSSIFLLPSGFAIFPDGHGKAHCTATTASSSSSAPINHSNNAGTLLTIAFQAMLPNSPSGNLATGAFDIGGQRICHVIKKIKDAVGANNVIGA